MKDVELGGSLNVDLEKISRFVNYLIPILTFSFLALGYFHSVKFYIPGAILSFLLCLNIYYLFIQNQHALLRNFGIMAQVRYILESIGPEFRQYLFLSDTEEMPFNRVERSEIYRKSKGVDSTGAFGSQKSYEPGEMKIRHSMYPVNKDDMKKFSLTFGEERDIKNKYEITHPILISAMSYGSLGEAAIRALSRGAKKSGIPMNTGEGGFPKYHLKEGADLIFQMGTAKFGVRNDDSSLNEEDLRKVAREDNVKMIEVKFSQGAKPGKGGLLPKEKITDEIAKLRGIEKGEDVKSPPYHLECKDPESTVKFIKRVQDISELPVGIKLCIGRKKQFMELIMEMKKQDTFPDYITIDGAEGGTGAAPKSFMDDVGVPIFTALPFVHRTLVELGVRNKLKLMAAGKLINASKQFMALSMGADAVYTARGFMLSIGCIQALQCNKNSCPVGIATTKKHLQKGLDIEVKSERVKNYVESLEHDYEELLAAIGGDEYADLNFENLYQEGVY